MTLDDLLHLDRRALSALITAGHPVDIDALRNREFNGVSLGLPRVVERFTWKKFKKVFVDAEDGTVRGYNEAVEDTPLSEPWISKRRRGVPVRYWPFRLRPVNGTSVPRSWDRGLLIDYGPPHRLWQPMGRMKDPIVALEPGSHELLLGVSYVDLGPLKIPTPTYFALMPGDPAPPDA